MKQIVLKSIKMFFYHWPFIRVCQYERCVYLCTKVKGSGKLFLSLKLSLLETYYDHKNDLKF